MSSDWEFSDWQRGESCTGSPTEGTKALAKWMMLEWEWMSSLGIYSCRVPSLHSEGRAFDGKIPTKSRGKPDAAKHRLVIERLGPHARRLGIATIIGNVGETVIHSKRSPGGRPYTGPHDHADHVHVGQTRAAGEKLTYATVVAVLGKPSGQTATPKPPPSSGTSKEFEDMRTLKVTDPFMRGLDVKTVQVLLQEAFGIRVIADGVYGPKTREAVKAFQKRRQIEVDGIVGPTTRTRLNGGK